MNDDERLQQIKVRCEAVKTEVLMINRHGDIEFAPVSQAAEIDPDIPWLLEQLKGEQARNDNFSDCFRRGLELYLDAHPGANYWPDGVANITWVLEQLEASQKRVVELQVENERLRTVLHHIVYQKPVISDVLDWYLEWEKLRDEAHEALKGGQI